MISPITPQRPLIWDDRIDTLRALITPDDDVYVVGGAVRDAYLHRPIHDVDLATPNDGRPLARHIANRLGGAYYPLDPDRGVGRAIIPWGDERITVDVAQFRGPNLHADLKARDFTINALAVRLDGDLQSVFDPLGGLDDLKARLLRQCDTTSIADDPVRALRGVRASVTFKLAIETSTQQSIRTAAASLTTVSPERLRDELFQILDTASPATAVRIMQQLGLLRSIIPEIDTMIEIRQSPPHQFDLWEHTVHTVAHLNALLSIIAPGRTSDHTANIMTGAATTVLDAFRRPLRAHVATIWANGRTHRSLLLLAALLHDVGKPVTRTVDDAGHIHFYDHEAAGERLAAERLRQLHLSNEEIARIKSIIRHHMRPHWLHAEDMVSRRAIYRFWRDTGSAGLDVCLLAMADYLATFGATLNADEWASYLASVQRLLNYYFEHAEDRGALRPLVTGQDILDRFSLTPGPQIGALLERLREAQAMGDIKTKEEALSWVQRILNNNGV